MMLRCVGLFLVAFMCVSGDENDLWDGDMMLTPEQRAAFEGNTQGYAQALYTAYWPRVIPYQLDESVLRNKDGRYLRAIEDAIEDLSNKTCLSFVKRTNETGYMKFVVGKSCYGPLGYVSIYPRVISLNFQCRTKGHVLHLIVHALGFDHESNRPDRDQYVKVVWDNIPKDKHKYFEKRRPGSVPNKNIPYDYLSIMHPHRYWQSKWSVTLIATDYYMRWKIGQRKELSSLDVLSINLAYRCPGFTRPPKTLPPIPTEKPEPEPQPTVEQKVVCGHLTDDLRCKYGYQLWISNATFGRTTPYECTWGRWKHTNCTVPDVLPKVRAKCHGKMECRLHAYRRDYGGECEGNSEYLDIRYRCVREAVMCWISGKHISCPTGQVLKIMDAFYGRENMDICPNVFAKKVGCKAKNSLKKTQELCDGKRTCHVLSSSAVYEEDPCPGSAKYLRVTYACVLPNTL